MNNDRCSLSTMRTNMKKLSEGLRQEGYRFTRQRQIILEEVQRQQSHPSAKEVYDAVKLRLPNISLGTVYRGLGVLVELGLIRKVEHGEYARFDANLVDHHHLICMNCDQLLDVDAPLSEPLNTQQFKARGFEVQGYKLELYGLCPTCAPNQS